MAYIPYITAWGRVVRQDEEPADKYSVTWGQVKTYYEVGAGGTTITPTKVPLSLTGQNFSTHEAYKLTKQTLTLTGKSLTSGINVTETLTKVAMTLLGKALTIVEGAETVVLSVGSLSFVGKILNALGGRIRRGLNRLGLSLRVD